MIRSPMFGNRKAFVLVRRVGGTLSAAGAIWLFALGCVHRIPASSLTVTRMHGVEQRLLDYVRTHQKMPTSLSQLPRTRGYDNSIADGWGRPILFELDGTRIIRLRSYGKDGTLGGLAEDADIVRECLFPGAQ